MRRLGLDIRIICGIRYRYEILQLRPQWQRFKNCRGAKNGLHHDPPCGSTSAKRSTVERSNPTSDHLPRMRASNRQHESTLTYWPGRPDAPDELIAWPGNHESGHGSTP